MRVAVAVAWLLAHLYSAYVLLGLSPALHRNTFLTAVEFPLQVYDAFFSFVWAGGAYTAAFRLHAATSAAWLLLGVAQATAPLKGGAAHRAGGAAFVVVSVLKSLSALCLCALSPTLGAAARPIMAASCLWDAYTLYRGVASGVARRRLTHRFWMRRHAAVGLSAIMARVLGGVVTGIEIAQDGAGQPPRSVRTVAAYRLLNERLLITAFIGTPLLEALTSGTRKNGGAQTNKRA